MSWRALRSGSDSATACFQAVRMCDVVWVLFFCISPDVTGMMFAHKHTYAPSNEHCMW